MEGHCELHSHQVSAAATWAFLCVLPIDECCAPGFYNLTFADVRW